MMFSLDLGDKQSIQKLLYWIALFSQCKLLFLQTKTVNSNKISFSLHAANILQLNDITHKLKAASLYCEKTSIIFK